MSRPAVSLLMVTRPGRLEVARGALADAARQVGVEFELVALTQAPAEEAGRAVDELADACHAAGVLTYQVACSPPGVVLGELRNRAVGLAVGDWCLQWDDDDRYHPERAIAQVRAAEARGAEACCLRSQVYWLVPRGEWSVVDWARSPTRTTGELIPGTLLARRATHPRYPALATGEDSLAVVGLMIRPGMPHVVALDRPGLYVRTWRHETQCSSLGRFAANIRDRGLPPGRLAEIEARLRADLTAIPGIDPSPKTFVSRGIRIQRDIYGLG